MTLELSLALKFYVAKTNGFSLVETIVAVGIFAAIAMGVSSLISNANKSEKMLSSRFNARQFYNEMSETLQDPQCAIPELFTETALSFTNGSWPKETKIALPSGVVGAFLKIKSGEAYDKLEISTLEIGPYYDRINSAYQYIGIDDTDLSKATIIKAAINIVYIDKTTPKRTPSPLNIPIYLSLDRIGNKIISCNNSNKLDILADFCQSVSGEWDVGTRSCELPCPTGTGKIDGRCESEDKVQSKTCGPTSSCGVTDTKHIL